MYELLVYVHIVSAVIWVGGAVYVQLLAMRVGGSDDPAELPRIARHFESLGSRVFVPAALLIIITGAVMTAQMWSFGQLWIAVSIALWVLSALAGALILAPGSKRAATLFEAEGPSSAAGRRVIGRLFLVSRLELMSFAVIIALMVFKPGA
ncbi:MAG TPA: DUF2269 family protein [Candidatus Limnocylindria bacterium]|jgi:uncharacterized membrane protein